MRLGRFSNNWTWALAAGTLLACNPSVFGGIYKSCQCNPSDEVFTSQFMGYYRTCWRPWPGGQPACPQYPATTEGGPASIERAEPKPSGASTAEPKKLEGPIEKLPPPEPEKK
jgi:hypothetical protein